MATLREIIPASPLEIAPYGLLGLVDPISMVTDRWVGGFIKESLGCTATVQLLDVCGGADPVVVINPSGNADQDYTPFGVEAFDECTTFGHTVRDSETRALDALAACTSKAIETEFWTGNLARANGYDDNRYLASPSAQLVTPGDSPIKIKHGLAILERALGDAGCGTRGTIHVTRDVASVLGAKDVDGHLETPLGNYVVAGTGYTGQGPDGSHPATGTWMYATGPVSVMLGAPEVPETEEFQNVDTNVNMYRSRAQLPAAVIWDGCAHFAVWVDLVLDYS